MPQTPPNNPDGRQPFEWATLLATEKPLFVVGGQAVNLWALHYRERTSNLAPFVSQDLDVLGTRDTLVEIARLAESTPTFFPMRPPTNEVGFVMAHSKGRQLPVEVLSHVHGISNDDLRHRSYTLVLGSSQVRVLVPNPIALLQAKIANVVDLNQEERQDVRHIRILVQLMPSYLAEVHAGVVAGRIKERDLIDDLEWLLRVATSRNARQAFPKLKIQPLRMFEELRAENGTKLERFLTNRLPRAL